MATMRRGFRPRGEARLFGAFLKKLRTHRHLSMRRLAKLAGISSTHLWQVEHGTRNPPSPQKLRRLAAHLHVSPTALMEAAGFGYWKGEDRVVRAKRLLTEAQFQRVLDDPLVRQRNIRPPDGLTPEIKQWAADMYSAVTNQNL